MNALSPRHTQPDTIPNPQRKKRRTVISTGVINIYGCHNCTHGSSERCPTCRRIDNDDLAIKRQEINFNQLFASRSATMLAANDCETWDDKAEQTLRFILDISNLTPLDLLAVITLARGGGKEDIIKAFNAFLSRMRRYTVTESDAGRNYRMITRRPKVLISRSATFMAIKKAKRHFVDAVKRARHFDKSIAGRIIYLPRRLAYVARAVLDEQDITLLLFSLYARGIGYTDIGLTLGGLAEPGELCERLIDKFSNPDELKDYVQTLTQRFRRYAEIIRDAFPNWHIDR